MEVLWGGVGSGTWWRFDKRDTVEDALCLDLYNLVKKRHFKWGIEHKRASLHWSYVNSSERKPAASVGYTLYTADADNARVELNYKLNGESQNYLVSLDYTVGHYGGKRMWFRCPLIKNGSKCNRRVAKLYLPTGSKYFGCRQCFGLYYNSQLLAPHDHFVELAWKYNAKLKGGVYGLEYVPRPKGMHRKTYCRLHEKMSKAVDKANKHAMYRFGYVLSL